MIDAHRGIILLFVLLLSTFTWYKAAIETLPDNPREMDDFQPEFKIRGMSLSGSRGRREQGLFRLASLAERL